MRQIQNAINPRGITYGIGRLIAFLVIVLLGLSSHAQTSFSPNVAFTLTDQVTSHRGVGQKNDTTRQFDYGQKIYAFLTFTAAPEQQPKQLTARWYHCNTLISVRPYVSKPLGNPHHVWFFHTSTDLGAGRGRVDIHANDTLIASGNFEVKTADGKNQACAPQARQFSLATDTLFSFNKSSAKDITTQGQADFDQLLHQINTLYSTIDSVVVVGHTDSLGSNRTNQQLSLARANTIRQLLIQKNIPASVIQTKGKGESEPITRCNHRLPTKALIACKAPDRRVTLLIQGVEKADESQ